MQDKPHAVFCIEHCCRIQDSKRYKILIVDDDPGILKMLIDILVQNSAYEVLTAGDGKAACAIAASELPDIIITDWEMPIMNGIEVVKELKRNPLTSDIPIIISTGVMIEASHMNHAFVSGAVDYIRKPFNEIELNARIENMIQISDQYATIKRQNKLLQTQLTSEILKIQQFDELKKWTVKQLTLLKVKGKIIDEKDINRTLVETERTLNSKAYKTTWVDFESHFETVNPGFFEKVNAHSGSLTINELRLCAFLKLHMSNKEISQILYTSADSVNTARKRLKKKLGMLAEDSLQQFFQNL